MKRIDFVRLRKRAGMSQRELADLLQVRPSFLSAIENGKSRMPEEKLDKIKEIFELDSLDDYMAEEHVEQTVPPHTHTMDQNDTLAQLLNHFHDLAHQREREHSGQDADMASRIEFLMKRNDRLSDRVDDLRDEVDALREENLRLKELLLKNGIQF
ncbi:MAG: helix-turn-helix domain-containing protein [Muribaculaceae bacterium]|nr:helix-turn-helix domain-containing protein [Muribaculaceae bacterium]